MLLKCFFSIPRYWMSICLIVDTPYCIVKFVLVRFWWGKLYYRIYPGRVLALFWHSWTVSAPQSLERHTHSYRPLSLWISLTTKASNFLIQLSLPDSVSLCSVTLLMQRNFFFFSIEWLFTILLGLNGQQTSDHDLLLPLLYFDLQLQDC